MAVTALNMRKEKHPANMMDEGPANMMNEQWEL